MKFAAYYASLGAPQKRDLASSLETSVAYLSQIAHGHRMPGARLLAHIERVTNGKVTQEEFRPDIYANKTRKRRAA